MKRCPTCNRTYPDAAAPFCAEDGARLVGDTVPPGTPQAAPPPQNEGRRPAGGQAAFGQQQYGPQKPGRGRSLAGFALSIIGLLAALLSIIVSLWVHTSFFSRPVAVVSLIVALLGLLCGAVAIFVARGGGKVLAGVALLVSLLAAGGGFMLAFVAGRDSPLDRLFDSGGPAPSVVNYNAAPGSNYNTSTSGYSASTTSGPTATVEKLHEYAEKGDVAAMNTLFSGKALREMGASKISDNNQHYSELIRKATAAGYKNRLYEVKETTSGDTATVTFRYGEPGKDSMGLGFVLSREGGEWRLDRAVDYP
jgi:hypothetical protein